MQSPTFDSGSDFRRSNLFWAAMAVLMLSQLVAFYLLCNGQVEKARSREAQVHAQRSAVSDCLRAAGSTIGSCMRSEALAVIAPPQDSGQTVMTSFVPVGFAYR